MSKITLIIKREYLTRIRKKSFIIMSILGPLIFAAYIFDGPGGHILPFVFVVRVGDKRIFQRFRGYPGPDPDITVGRNQRNAVFTKKIFGGVHDGRSE